MTLFIRDQRYVIKAAKQVAVKRLLKDIVLVIIFKIVYLSLNFLHLSFIFYLLFYAVFFCYFFLFLSLVKM